MLQHTLSSGPLMISSWLREQSSRAGAELYLLVPGLDASEAAMGA